MDHVEARGDIWLAPLSDIADHVMRRFAANGKVAAE